MTSPRDEVATSSQRPNQSQDDQEEADGAVAVRTPAGQHALGSYALAA
jgi:hypothetical protein